jgi:hypothetical protein
MASERPHPRVPPTKANFDVDFRNKEKLGDEFEEFKEVFEQAAKSSPDVQKLKVPLAKLESAIKIGAFGIVFVQEDEKK